MSIRSIRSCLKMFVWAIVPLLLVNTIQAVSDRVEIQLYSVGFADEDTNTYPNLNIYINNQLITTFEDIRGSLNPLNYDVRSYTTDEAYQVETIKVEYTNSQSGRQVLINKILLNGREIGMNWPSVYSEGAWSPNNGCGPGYKEKNILTCAGYFEVEIPDNYLPRFAHPSYNEDGQAPNWEGERAVSESEQGYLFMWPRDLTNFAPDLSQAHALVMGVNQVREFAPLMPEGSLKIPHSRMNSFSPDDEIMYTLFPWTDFVNFNQAEIDAGRPGLIITADGEPVTRSWGGQAVAVGDDRYIDFWINKFIKPKYLSNPVSGEPYPYENIWVGVDEAIFRRCLFTPCFNWDEPFPQSEAEYLEDIEYFFQQVKQLEPELKIMANGGGMADELQFERIFEHLDGYMVERYPDADYKMYLDNDSAYLGFINQVRRIIWLGQQGKVAIPRPIIDAANFDDSLEFSYLLYLATRGDNFFFGPILKHDDDSPVTDLVDPVHYQHIGERLGWHTSQPVEISRNAWKRFFENGVVYLNLDQTNHLTINLDSGVYYQNGLAVRQVSLEPMSAVYLLDQAVETPATSLCSRSDINSDGIIDVSDYHFLVKNFQDSATNLLADINADGLVDLNDYQIMVDHFFKTCVNTK